MSSSSPSPSPGSSSSKPSPESSQPAGQVTQLPSRLPTPTGNLLVDSFQSARHITEVPCARNSLLYGIAGGFGIGVIRGLSANPMVAGNWAVGAFAAISLGSWHICQNALAEERRKVEKIIQGGPQRKAAAAKSAPAGGASPESQ